LQQSSSSQRCAVVAKHERKIFSAAAVLSRHTKQRIYNELFDVE